MESNLSASFIDCEFSHNVADFDGGAMSSSGLLSVSVTACHFANNDAENGSGGAVAVTRSSFFEISDSIIQGNTALKIGGGISAVQSNLSLHNTTFINNEAPVYGGALSILSTFSITVLDCHFEANHAFDGHGGALFLNSPTAHLLNNTFVRNSAFEGGAVLFVVPYSPSKSKTLIAGCLFDSNVASSAGKTRLYRKSSHSRRLTVCRWCYCRGNRAPLQRCPR